MNAMVQCVNDQLKKVFDFWHILIRQISLTAYLPAWQLMLFRI